jgi:diguanylate cyclase (GGDEF)-like protein
VPIAELDNFRPWTSTGGDEVSETTFDAVTGAWSRASLEPLIAQELARARRNGEPCAVFLFDVDFFKTVNDVYGHQRGDETLRQIADRIIGALRSDDTLFRYGGDEFVVLLPGVPASHAVAQAISLTAQIRDTPFPGEPPLNMSISLGVATYPADGTDVASLLLVADRRNYLAKHRGRGGAVADDAPAEVEASSSRLWERDIALAGTHHFLTALLAQRYGALCVTGQPGAGHTRFMQEVRRLAGLRGYSVLDVVEDARAAPPSGPTLLLADVGEVTAVPELLARWGAAMPAVLGVAFACTTSSSVLPGDMPVLATVEVAPWSPATIRIWLRSVLRGEPTDPLTSWIVRQSGGLPAAAARELEGLRERGGLVSDGAGSWSVRPAMVGRASRRVALPSTVSSLVGRGPEHSRVAVLLRSGRLVTLIGPGGVGKTRLSLAIAESMADDFEDGAVFVALTDTTTSDEALKALAAALDVDQIPGVPLLDEIAERLADQSLLLVLDNLEQVREVAPAFGRLLSAAPALTILATSREALDIYGEQVYRVPPLPLADLPSLPRGAEGVALALERSPAVALFDQRARAARDDFRLSADTLAPVAELCRRLDGLPLAIELAAARIVALEPAELLEHLGHHLDTLGGGPSDRAERQQTLRGAIDWSVALLDDDTQLLFEAVGVFTGGCRLAAAEAVAGNPDPAGGAAPAAGTGRVAEQLVALVAKSLLTVGTDPDGEPRYRMLETIRAYAAARLAERGAEPVRDRHRAHFVALALAAAAGMAGPDQARWTERIDREYPNLRTAMVGALERGDDAARDLCLGLWRYWRRGAHLSQGRRWIDETLSGLRGAAREELLYPAAVLAATQDDDAAATRLGLECLQLAEAGGNRETTARARNILGVAAMRAGRFAEAAEHFGFGLELWRELDQPQGTATALGNLSKLALLEGRTTAAAEYIHECLALERSTGNSAGVLLGLECLGEILLARGDLVAARITAAEALALSVELGDIFGEATALHQQALIAREAGEFGAARELFAAALVRRYEVGDREDLAVSFDCLAEVIADTEPERAIRLLAAAESLHQARRIGALPDSGGRREATQEALRRAVGDQVFAAAWRSGRRASLESIVAESAPAVADGFTG